ncbi:hypothetical protein HHK36_014727 [Tetracentron sinense]|uniref:Uncharacterized protein n=1 Tax=Tetracentron sinense TaxID=13715 RepID=A0A835DCZ6_TETSI|nr:hypothetical protein HHK36_014727 [Tetracentron sinense]
MGSIPEMALGSGGQAIPLLGMGTAAYPFVASEATKLSILHAIELGYRHFDTAAVYQSGKPVGEAIHLGSIKSRDKLFITSKLWCIDAHRHLILPALRQTLQWFGVKAVQRLEQCSAPLSSLEYRFQLSIFVDKLGVIDEHYGDCVMNDSGLGPSAFVDSLISNGHWHTPPASTWDLLQVWNAASRVQLRSRLSGDKIIWKPSSSGSFSIKSSWNALRTPYPLVDWGSLLWFPLNIKRHSFISWLALSDRLQTQDRLVKHAILNTSKCCFCQNSNENLEHLFFACRFTQSIWKHILSRIRFNSRQILSWAEEVKWILKETSKGDPIDSARKLCFNASIYHIWLERNARIFQNQFLPIEIICNKILRDTSLRLNRPRLELLDTPSNRDFFLEWNIPIVWHHVRERWCSWLPPPEGVTMINIEGSLTNNAAGCGAIFRDHQGEPILAFGSCFHIEEVGSYKSSLHIELLAIQKACKIAKDYDLVWIQLVSDSKGNLQLEYIDLYLIHLPVSLKPGECVVL